MVFCISVVSIMTSPFSLLILFIWVFSLLFVVSLARGLSIFFIFSKNQLLVFIDFFYCFLNLYFIDFLLIFMISFLLLTLGFVCSFSNSFRCWVVNLRFFFFFEEGLYCYEFPSEHCFCGIP